jgi:hypothetical protein
MRSKRQHLLQVEPGMIAMPTRVDLTTRRHSNLPASILVEDLVIQRKRRELPDG